MGVVTDISETEYPKQGEFLNKRCRVVFNYGPTEFLGTMVRDDVTDPYVGIIKLDNGRYVLTDECQFALVK